MLKLIIVDDEKVIRDNIASIVDWQKFGYRLEATCENGLDALTCAEEILPDLVITDIKMPFMDGIELAKRLRKLMGSSVKIIFLTGFDEFDYAQQAINLKAEDYILKPASADMLIKVLTDVKAQIDKEVQIKRDFQRLSQYYESSMPLLRNSYLNRLISGKTLSQSNEIAWEKHEGYLNAESINGRFFLIALICIDPESFSKPDDAADRELYNYAVLNIATEVLSEDTGIIVFPSGQETVVLLTAEEQISHDSKNRLDSQLEIIRLSIAKFLPFKVSIGISNHVEGTENIHEAYEAAIAALQYRILQGGNRLLHISDFETANNDSIRITIEDENKLITAIKTGQQELICQVIDQAFQHAITKQASPVQLNNLILSIYLAVWRESEAANIEIDPEWTPAALSALLEYHGIQAVIGKIRQTCLDAANSIQDRRIDSSRFLAYKARDYIDQKYADSKLSVVKICNYLNISSSYFSVIFKKEFGEQFSSYVLKVRMNKARELILANRERKSYEIASEVGFQDPHYFSFCFKKFFGTSPTELRKSK
ncbi:MAG: response regulator [Saccharofermentanales bacterium]|jgi:two-component system response regulator YesN